MKKTINGKRYDSAKCEILGETRHYYNGNYCGCLRLLKAKDGTLLLRQTSNGQDIYHNEYMREWGLPEDSIDDFEMDEDQEKRCAELGLIKIDD